MKNLIALLILTFLMTAGFSQSNPFSKQLSLKNTHSSTQKAAREYLKNYAKTHPGNTKILQGQYIKVIRMGTGQVYKGTKIRKNLPKIRIPVKNNLITFHKIIFVRKLPFGIIIVKTKIHNEPDNFGF